MDDCLNLLLGSVCMVYIVFFPIVAVCILRQNTEKLHEEEVVQKVGALYEGLRTG